MEITFKDLIKKNVIVDHCEDNKCFKTCKYLKRTSQAECFLFFELLRISQSGLYSRCKKCIAVFGNSFYAIKDESIDL